MLKVFEAFAGYGSQRMALRNLDIEHEVVAISEFDKYADASYQAIHGETWNMDDITKIDVDDVPDHDLFTYSFPCQDISVAGKGKGFSKDSGTRSGLLWESERIIKAKKPKYLLMENVKNLISEKFMPGFVEWILALEELGYSNYYEVLNAKDFGIPQNRERVFMVSILGEHEPYVFPKPIKLEKRLKDVLEEEVDERYYLDNERAQQLIATITDVKDIEQQEGLKMNRNEVSGKSDIAQTLTADDSKGVVEQIDKNNVKGTFYANASERFQRGIYPLSRTLKASNHDVSVTDGYRIRKLTPLECFRLMDVTDEDFYKAQAVNSNSQLYKQAGNSIVVSVLEAIFRNMFLEVPEKDLIGEHISLF